MAEIKRLRRLPAVDDYAGIKTKMIERLLEVAENDASATARHRAIQTLLRYAQEGAERHVTSDPETDIAALVRELTADVELRVAMDRPSVEGEKNRRGNQKSATDQLITGEATTEVVAQTTAKGAWGCGCGFCRGRANFSHERARISLRKESRPPVFRAAGSGFFRPHSGNFSQQQ
jgi:hypothetical protein